jgi:hypothetical protein
MDDQRGEDGLRQVLENRHQQEDSDDDQHGGNERRGLRAGTCTLVHGRLRRELEHAGHGGRRAGVRLSPLREVKVRPAAGACLLDRVGR